MKVVAVSGRSMWPALKTGDLVFVDPSKKPCPGELVYFHEGDVATVHRWLGPGLCKGDHEIHADEPSCAQNIQTVWGVVPRRRLKNAGQVAISPQAASPLVRLMQRLQSGLSILQMRTQNRVSRRVYRLLLIANGWLMRILLYLNVGAQSHVMLERH